MPDGMLKDASLRAGRPNDSHHDFDERAFTRAVRPEEAKDLTARHPHGNPAQGLDPTFVDLGDVAKINREFPAH